MAGSLLRDLGGWKLILRNFLYNTLLYIFVKRL